VAVRAQNTDVLEAIVRVVPIDVVEAERKGLAPPRGETARLAMSGLGAAATSLRLKLLDVVIEPSTSNSARGVVVRAGRLVARDEIPRCTSLRARLAATAAVSCSSLQLRAGDTG
jgi:hypothetical protein